MDTASERPDRGYAIVDSGALVWFGSKPPGPDAGPIDVVAGERPWTVKGRGAKLTGERLITFAMNNGFQLRDAWPYDPRPIFVALKVRDWKNLALPGCASMPGDIYCRNLAQRLKLPLDTNHNHLDAAGIALAASRLSLDQLKKLVQKGFK